MASWQGIAAADGLLVQDEQQVLAPGAWLAALLAIASVAVLAAAVLGTLLAVAVLANIPAHISARRPWPRSSSPKPHDPRRRPSLGS